MQLSYSLDNNKIYKYRSTVYRISNNLFRKNEKVKKKKKNKTIDYIIDKIIEN